jgi:hypothetical protein
MRIQRPRLPIFSPGDSYLPRLLTELESVLQAITDQLNGVTEGRHGVFHGASTAAPTTGTWAVGDFVRNVAPAEAGSASSKYVITGWVCTVAGTPGTWLESRVLTGN